MADQNQTDKHNISKQGDSYVAVVTRYFDDMDRAVQWAESTYLVDTPEQAASDLTAAGAEAINSNVNPAPIPAGAEQVLSGSGSDGTTEGAPTPQDAAAELAVDNTAAGTHDPSLETDTTQVPATDGPQASQPSSDTPSATTSKSK